MEDSKHQDQIAAEAESSRNVRRYTLIALTVFATFCCCTLFFFMIYRYTGVSNYWKKLVTILQPIIIGLVLGYLLNPVMKFVEKYAARFLKGRVKSEKTVKKLSRGIGIVGAVAFLILIFVLLIAAIVPSISESVQEIVIKLPEEVKQLIAWVDEYAKGDTELAAFVNQVIETATTALQDFLNITVLPQIQTYVAQITSGAIFVVKLLINILVGLIVSVYVMAAQEKFAGQAKKIIYALFKPVRANVIIKTARKSNEIFGGFITGKLLDSLIIGLLAYIVLTIMGMPDTVLVAVIIGVTNVIPFFGPFIGAIPSFIIIVLQDPMKGIYFLIFVVILQQIDGNIIGPKILGNSTGLSSFWVVFAILVFGGLWGFFGMLLGVPIMAVIYYIVDETVKYFLGRRGLKTDTDSYVYLKCVDKETNELIYEPKEDREPVQKERKKRKDEPEKEE